MNLLNKLKYFGLCAGIAALALNAPIAWAAGDDDDADISVTIVEPSVTATAADSDLGDWAVVNKSTGPVGKLTISTAGVVDQTAAGVYPNARFIEIDDTATPLKLVLTGGAFNQQLSFAVGAADAAPGVITGPTITLALNPGPGTATFLIDNWNCAVDTPAYGAGFTPELFAPDVAHGSNGLGVVTLGTADGTPNVNDGGANIACGFDISTDGLGGAYASGNYTGTARFVVDYI